MMKSNHELKLNLTNTSKISLKFINFCLKNFKSGLYNFIKF